MDGLIRKLVVGRDPKNAMAYYSGMRAGDGKVSAILQDEAYLHKFGKTRYLVYIEGSRRYALPNRIRSRLLKPLIYSVFQPRQ